MKTRRNPHGFWSRQGRVMWLVLVSIVVLLIVLGFALKKGT